MSVISKLNYYGEDKRDWEGKPISNINYKGVDYHFAERNQVTDGICINAVEEPLYDMQVSGNSVQDGTPSTETPVEVQSVGDKTSNILNNEEITYAYNAENIVINRDSFSFINIKTKSSSYIYNFKYLDIGTYTISGSVSLSDGLNGGWAIYDEQNSVYLINNSSVGKIEGSFEITEARRYRICFFCNYNSPDGTVATYTNIKLEKGTTSTEYEPYGYKLPIKANDITTKIYLKEPLRKIGDYADYIDFKNKRVIRKINKLQINDTSDIFKFSAVTNWSAFYLNKSDLISFEENKSMNVKIIAKTFIYHPCGGGNTNNSWSGTYNIGGSVYTTYRRISFTLPNTITNVANAKQWLANNPIDCYYPITGIAEETIEIPEISTTKGTNIFAVQTEIQPSALSVEYWKQI